MRVDPAAGTQLVNTTSAVPAVMRGRPMAGWLRVPSEDLTADTELARWVSLSVGYARSLPPK